MAFGCVSKKTAKVTLGISFIVLIISIVVIVSFQTIYNTVLKNYVALGEGSLVTKIWEDIPLPIYEKLYFFNITNEEAFLEGSQPLNVTEVGPYTYKSKWVKTNLKWNSNNTVSYREVRTYHFMPDLSNGTEDDIILTLNGPMIVAANIVPPMLRMPLDLYCMFEGETLVTRKSIRELAYEGYNDPIIKFAGELKPDVPYKDGKFSWLYGKNATDDGLFTVFTGTDDESKTNFINNWDGKEMLSFWKNDTCNMINGTSIETGPPIKDYLDSYAFFQSLLCRSLAFKYTEDVKHFDIQAKRFRPTYDLFANTTENPDNHCFEVQKERASGVLDISPCQFGAPVLVSFPHFHLADSSYLNSVNGLDPNDEKHGSYVDVEPITGVSIDLTVRIQINLEIEEIQGFHFFTDVTKGVLPVFWAEMSLKIDEDLANYLKSRVRNPKIIAYSLLGVLCLMSCVGVIISIIILCGYKSEIYEPLTVIEDNKVLSQSDYTGEKCIEKNVADEKDKSIESDSHSSMDFSIYNSKQGDNLNELSAEQVEAPVQTCSS